MYYLYRGVQKAARLFALAVCGCLATAASEGVAKKGNFPIGLRAIKSVVAKFIERFDPEVQAFNQRERATMVSEGVAKKGNFPIGLRAIKSGFAKFIERFDPEVQAFNQRERLKYDALIALQQFYEYNNMHVSWTNDFFEAADNLAEYWVKNSRGQGNIGVLEEDDSLAKIMYSPCPDFFRSACITFWQGQENGFKIDDPSLGLDVCKAWKGLSVQERKNWYAPYVFAHLTGVENS